VWGGGEVFNKKEDCGVSQANRPRSPLNKRPQPRITSTSGVGGHRGLCGGGGGGGGGVGGAAMSYLKENRLNGQPARTALEDFVSGADGKRGFRHEGGGIHRSR